MNQVKDRYISCVEYYLINYLCNMNFDIRKYYYDSFKNSYDIIYDFINSNISFLEYEGIKKIQNTLMDCHVLSYKVYKRIHWQKIFQKDTIYLLLVNKNFFANQKYKALRNDHFIHLFYRRKYLYCFNSFPKEKRKVTKKEIKDFYDKKGIFYVLKRSNDISINRSYSLFLNNIKKLEFKKINTNIFLPLYKLKDIFYILKVSRYRLLDLLMFFKENKIEINDLLINYLDMAVNYYSSMIIKIEMLNHRKCNDEEVVQSMLYKINTYEEKIFKLLKELS